MTPAHGLGDHPPLQCGGIARNQSRRFVQYPYRREPSTAQPYYVLCTRIGYPAAIAAAMVAETVRRRIELTQITRPSCR